MRAIPVRFTGDAREYFGIWIVNFLISVVTFGIYSAWAKVRNKQYFLGNTTIDARPFEYHATGRQILIGRAMVLAGLAILWAISWLFPSAAGAVVFSVVAVPFLINRGLRFNAAMTSWSGVRFRFEADERRALFVLGIYPVLALFTLYLAFPYVARAAKRYVIGNHLLGGHRFSFASSIGPFYWALLWSVTWAVGVVLVIFGSMILTGGLPSVVGRASQPGTEFGVDMAIAAIIVFGPFLIALLPLATIYGAFVRNAIYAGTTLEGGHRFESTISPIRLIWIAISNAIAIVVSIGMLLPWARIRVARYLCANTWITPAGSLDRFVDDAEDWQSAYGDAYMDIDGADAGGAI